MTTLKTLALAAAATLCVGCASESPIPSGWNPDYDVLNDDRNVKDKIGDAGYGDHKAYFDAAASAAK